MAERKVEFLSVSLLQKHTGVDLGYNIIKEKFDAIFDAYAVDTEEGKALDLRPDIMPYDVEPKIILDIYENTESMLFARMCRKKPNNALIRRDYDSLETEDVLAPEELKKYGIEVFTFFMLDYQHGILAIVNAKDAPGAKVLNWIFEKYDRGFDLGFVNIPNSDGINMLYNAGAPKISEYEFVVPTPDARFLQDVLGMDETEIANIVTDNVQTATLILKPEPYRTIEHGTERIRRVLDILTNKKEQYDKVLVKGRSDDFNTTSFDLHEQYFTYPIEIRKYRMRNNKKEEFTTKELREQYREAITEAYMNSRELLLAVTNREDDRIDEEN